MIDFQIKFHEKNNIVQRLLQQDLIQEIDPTYFFIASWALKVGKNITESRYGYDDGFVTISPCFDEIYQDRCDISVSVQQGICRDIFVVCLNCL